MELTDKCLKDFEKYVECLEVAPYTSMLGSVPKCYLNALIIEFFDSVGYYIEILKETVNHYNTCSTHCEGCEDCYDYWTVEFEYMITFLGKVVSGYNDFESVECENDPFNSREEATTEAIRRCNDLYNLKFKL